MKEIFYRGYRVQIHCRGTGWFANIWRANSRSVAQTIHEFPDSGTMTEAAAKKWIDRALIAEA
ncbi:hypothetical protein DLM45_10960 [Hyphomicrobium methylovorum]|nr:hypothetical protein [Hyphomicrobium methylovorum]